MSVMCAGREFAKGLIDRSVSKALGSVGGKSRRAFLGLLWNVQARSELLRPRRFEGRAEAVRLDELVGGLLALASTATTGSGRSRSGAPRGRTRSRCSRRWRTISWPATPCRPC